MTSLPPQTALLLFEVKTHGIDTIALSRRGGAIIKDMPQMRPAARAGDFGAHHSVAHVLVVLYRVRKGLVKRRPARARIKFCVRAEQRIPAGFALIGAVGFFVHVFTREWPLRPLLAENIVLFGCKKLLESVFTFWQRFLSHTPTVYPENNAVYAASSLKVDYRVHFGRHRFILYFLVCAPPE